MRIVIGYVWSQVKDQYGFKKYTYEKLKDEIMHFVVNPKQGISTLELISSCV